MSASRGEWSPPQSPFGGFRGKKKYKRFITSSLVDLFVYTRRRQGAGCACDRKQSILAPYNAETFETDPVSFN